MKTTLTFLLVIASIFAIAQDEQTSVKLNKFELLHETVFLNEKGLVFKIGSFNEKGSQRLQHYSVDARLLWEKQIENKYGTRNSKNFVVTSPDGAVVYYIETKDDGFPDKTQYITRVTRDGKSNTFEVQGKDHFGKSLQTVFCDEDYLYFLSTENGNERHDSKKSNEKLILTRFGHADISPRKMTLPLPAVAEGENTTFWSFVGQKGKVKYFVSKKIDIQSSKQLIEIAVIDSEGQFVKKNTIEVDLEGAFPRPAYEVDAVNRGVFEDADLDFNEVYVPATSSGSSSFPTGGYSKLSHTQGAFSHVGYDDRTGAFYVYGLFGPKPYKRVGPVYEGFFVQKFDADGKNLWRLKYKGVKDLMNESFFRIHGMPSDRTVSMKKLPDGRLNFSIHFKGSLFTYEISEDGKVVTSRRKDKYDQLTDDRILSKQPVIQSDAFMKSRPEKATSYLSEDGETVIVFDDKNSKIDVLFFGREGE